MFIGLDLGTSSLKAILIDAGQRVLAEHSVPLTVQRPHDGWSEQDPRSWCDAAVAALKALAGKHDCSGVLGIGLSGHKHGATLLGQYDTPLCPCNLWHHTWAVGEVPPNPALADAMADAHTRYKHAYHLLKDL